MHNLVSWCGRRIKIKTIILWWCYDTIDDYYTFNSEDDNKTVKNKVTTLVNIIRIVIRILMRETDMDT